MPLFGQSGEAHTRALEKDDSLPVKDLLEIQGEKREDYPDYLLAKGGRVGLAEGDTPSQAWMRNNFFEALLGINDLTAINRSALLMDLLRLCSSRFAVQRRFAKEA